MRIPSWERCLSLMEELRMPVHIQDHSFVVAQIALYLGGLLNRNGCRLDLPLLTAGALLHDIAKAQALASGERHEELGGLMAEERGYGAVSVIIREHVSLDRERLRGPMTESLVVNYADKRVKHDQVVSLEDRFFDLIRRYARTREHRAWIESKLVLYRELEQKIFEHLNIGPEDLERLAFRGRPFRHEGGQQ